MRYKWRPNATQRKEFAERMKDHDEQASYEQRKREKTMYENWKDKDFVPTKGQHDFCLNHIELFITSDEQTARDMVMYGYSCNEKVNHTFIHIVNEKRRTYPSIN